MNGAQDRVEVVRFLDAGVAVAGLVLVLGRDDDRRRVVPVHFALEIG